MVDDQHVEAAESIILKRVAISSQEEFHKLITCFGANRKWSGKTFLHLE
jgi:hypothetical protein